MRKPPPTPKKPEAVPAKNASTAQRRDERAS